MKMKTVAIVLGAVTLVVVAVMIMAAGLWIGSTALRAQADDNAPGRILAASMGSGWNREDEPYPGGPGMMGGSRNLDGRPNGPISAALGMMQGNQNWGEMPCAEGYAGPDMMWGDQNRGEMPCAEGYAEPGMMGEVSDWNEMPCGQSHITPDGESILSLEEAEAAAERYVERLGYTGLHVTEVMHFEHNFYAIVAEEDTGIGAMELLVDSSNDAVGLEPGPNMMWNAKYGMHSGGRMGMRMMGSYATGEMTLSPAQVEEIAQRWLDASLPGRSAGEADPFYGYYTLHFLKDGEIEGMLSVHGSTGDVWYHNWHGTFIAMVGEHE